MPPVELSQLTILNLVAIVSYTLAMLFHVIAFTTDNWSYLTLEGVQWKMGLWRGCRHVEADDSWNCTVDVFQDKVFQTGSDWHSGSQVIMTFALILLFLLEFAIIIYACIKKFERHRDRVVGCVLALSLTAGGCLVIGITLSVLEAKTMVGRHLEWSFGLDVLSLLFLVVTTVCLLLNRYEMKKQKGSMRKSVDSIHNKPGFEERSFIVTGVAVFEKDVHVVGTSDHRVSWSLQLDIVAGVIVLVVGVVSCVDRVRTKRTELEHALSRFCHFLVVVMYGSEVGKVPGSWVSSSYALVVICLLLEVTIPVIILFDKSKRFPEDRIYILTGKPKPKPQPTFSLDTAKPPVESHGRHVSMVTKGPETLRKFAPYVIDDHASAIRETSRGLGNSTGSLPDGRRASSGSWASQQTQSTMFTNVSFQPDSSERGSVESMV